MDGQRLKQFWDQDVPKKWKHFVRELPDEMIDERVSAFHTHCLDKIPIEDIEQAIDWGCGGGILANELPKSTTLHLVDISVDSMDEATRFLRRGLRYVLPAAPAREQFDLLWCYAVIHHLPSIAHYRWLSQVFLNIRPTWLALNAKVAEQWHVAEDYERDYLKALIISDTAFTSPWREYYDCVHIETVDGMTYGLWKLCEQ